MLRMRLMSLSLVLLGCSWLMAQEAEKGLPWPEIGSFIPGPFEFYHLSGPAKGHFRCFVCHTALTPTVLIFANEAAKDKDGTLNDLLKKLDEMITEFEYRGFSVAVLFLSPDASDSTNNADEKKATEIIKEAIKRQDMLKRIETRIDPLKLKDVVVGYYPLTGPKAYKLDPKAELTVVFYERMKLLDYRTYQADGLQAKDVAAIVQRVREGLSLKKKKAPDEKELKG